MAQLLTAIEAPLVREAVSFVYQALQTDLDAFFEEHAGAFDLSTEEHKLEYTEIHQQYEALLEERLTEFAASKGFESPAEFAQALQKACNESERSNKMVQMLLVAMDYDKFVKLMRIKAKALEQKWRSEAKAADAFSSGEESKEAAQVAAAAAAAMQGKGDSKVESEESEEDGGWIEQHSSGEDEEAGDVRQAESKSGRK